MRLDPFLFRHSFKIGLAALIVVICNNFWHLELGFFSLISAFVVLQSFPIATMEKGLERIFGILFWVTMALLIIRYVPYYFLYALLAAIILFITSCLFQLNLLGYANLLGGIIGIIVLVVAVKDPHAGITLGIDAMKTVSLGVGVALLVQALVFPFNAYRKLASELADTLQQLRYQFFLVDNKVAPISITKLASLTALLDQCKADILAKNESYTDFRAMLFDIKNLYFKASLLKHIEHHLTNPLGELFRQDLIHEFESLKHTMRLVEQHIRMNTKIAPPETVINPIINKLKNKLDSLRKEDATVNYELNDVLSIASIINVMQSINETLCALISVFNQALAYTHPKRVKKTKAIRNIIYTRRDIKGAIKMAVSMLCLCILYLYAHYPGGIQSIITVMVIIAQPDVGMGAQKNIQRMLGILIGAIIGLLFAVIINALPYFSLFLVIIFFSYALCAYLGVDNPKYTYICMQVGIIIALIIAVNNGPYIDLKISVERVIGVFFGGFIAVFIHHFLWPVHPHKLILKQLLETKHYIIGFVSTLDPFKFDRSLKYEEQISANLMKSLALLVNTHYDFLVRNHTQSIANTIDALNLVFNEAKHIRDLTDGNELAIQVVKSIHAPLLHYIKHSGKTDLNATDLIRTLDKATESIRKSGLSTNVPSDKILAYASVVVSLKNLIYNVRLLNHELIVLEQCYQKELMHLALKR